MRSSDTAPELLVRQLLTRMGYRYRLHRIDIPGNPDIAFIGKRKAVFVHGCFWHGHDCKRGARTPATNAGYWSRKIARNRARDVWVAEELAKHGWDALTIWECELKNLLQIEIRFHDFLGQPRRNSATSS